jgi:hypothetical protein
MAEAVALSPEEAAISLEAEMFRTFAAEPAATSTATSTTTPGSEIALTQLTGVSAVAAVVENRLAAAGLDASTNGESEPGDEHGLSGQPSSEHGPESTADAASVMEAPAEVNRKNSRQKSTKRSRKILRRKSRRKHLRKRLRPRRSRMRSARTSSKLRWQKRIRIRV